MSTTESIIRQGFRYIAGAISLGAISSALFFINIFIKTTLSELITFMIHSMTYTIIWITFMPLSLYAIIKSGKKEVPFRYMLTPFFVGIGLYTIFRKYYIDKFNSFNSPSLFDLNVAVIVTIVLLAGVILYMKKSLNSLRDKDFRLDNTKATVLIIISLILIIVLSLNIEVYNNIFFDIAKQESFDSPDLELMRAANAKAFWSAWFRIFSFLGIIVGIVALYENNKEDKLIKKYTQQIKDNPYSFIPYYYRGFIYDSKGDKEKSKADFEKSRELDTQGAIIFTGKGSEYTNNNELNQALDAYNMAIELEPRFFFAYALRAMLNQKTQDYENARLDYLRATELDKDLSKLLKINGLMKKLPKK